MSLGSFVAALETKAAEMNSTSFSTAIITVVLFSDPTVTPAPKYQDGDGNEGLSVGAVVGVVVGSIVGAWLLVLLCVYCVCPVIARRKSAHVTPTHDK